MKTVQLDDNDHAILKQIAELERRSMPAQVGVWAQREAASRGMIEPPKPRMADSTDANPRKK